MLKGLEQVMQGRFRTGTVEVLKYNQDKQNNFAMLPKLFNPCLRDTLIAHLYYSTLHNFSVRQVTDSVTRGAGDYPGCLGLKAGLHPGHVASLSLGHIQRQTNIHTHIHTYCQFRVANQSVCLWTAQQELL